MTLANKTNTSNTMTRNNGHTFCENQSSGRPGFPNGLIALLTETLTQSHIHVLQ